MPRALEAVIVIAALVGGCDPLVFDHTPGQCVRADDGTPCDDGNICTTATVCRVGVCGGQNPVDICTVADSDQDFAASQGDNGWFYGYWNASADVDGNYDSSADFVEMEYCADQNWSPPGRWMPPGRCQTDRDGPGYRWTMILILTQYPETRPDIELPIRRWVSDVSGPARMLVDNFVGGDGGDGSRAMLFVERRVVAQRRSGRRRRSRSGRDRHRPQGRDRDRAVGSPAPGPELRHDPFHARAPSERLISGLLPRALLGAQVDRPSAERNS